MAAAIEWMRLHPRSPCFPTCKPPRADPQICSPSTICGTSVANRKRSAGSCPAVRRRSRGCAGSCPPEGAVRHLADVAPPGPRTPTGTLGSMASGATRPRHPRNEDRPVPRRLEAGKPAPRPETWGRRPRRRPHQAGADAIGGCVPEEDGPVRSFSTPSQPPGAMLAPCHGNRRPSTNSDLPTGPSVPGGQRRRWTRPCSGPLRRPSPARARCPPLPGRPERRPCRRKAPTAQAPPRSVARGLQVPARRGSPASGRNPGRGRLATMAPSPGRGRHAAIAGGRLGAGHRTTGGRSR